MLLVERYLRDFCASWERQFSDSHKETVGSVAFRPCSYVEQQDGLLVAILSYLEVSEVVRSKRVSKRWQELCNTAIEVNFQPKKEFSKDGCELRRVARKYCKYEIESMNEIGRTYGFPINKWAVGKVRDFSRVFQYQMSFNEALDKWDTSQAKSFNCMFLDARSFNKPLDSWNTSEAVSMSRMFNGAASFDGSLASWDIKNVRDLSLMFCGAISFNQPLDTWDTGSAKDMTYMFARATHFNQNLATWDMSTAKNMKCMFMSASSFNQDLSSWETSGVENMFGMFQYATSFDQDLSSWDCSGLEAKSPDSYYRILAGATAFQQGVPESLDHEIAFDDNYSHFHLLNHYD